MTFRLAALAFFFAQAWPASYGIQCAMLQTKRIYYTQASCEGQLASSCWTVVTFDLPSDLPGVPLTSKSVTLDSLTSVTGHYGLGLAVVHGHKPREPAWSPEDRDADGLHYSIDTRVVQIGSGPRVLQVQLLYSEASQDNISPTPGWSNTASSLQVHPGGKEIKLDVMFCSPEPEHWGHDRLGFASLPRTHPSSMESYSTQDLQPYQDDLPVVDWMAALRNPSSVAVGRARNLIKTVPEPLVNANVNGDAHRDDQSEAQSLSHSLRGGGRGLQNGPGALAPSSGVSSSEESLERPPRGGGGGGVLSNLGACDPYHEGNDWCSAAVSPAESRALEIQGTEMYCSRECADRGALWCNIFGKRNCRMCSNDCDEFCLGNPDCHCHKCPVSGATETWSCTVGAEMACYDQITRQDYASLVKREQRLTCTPTCLDEGGGLWCDAMGVNGCRFCAVDCEEHCALGPNPEECECVECEDGLELPELQDPLSSASSLSSSQESRRGPLQGKSCAHEEDGDAFCWSQVPEEAQLGFEAQGVGIECHSECLEGEVWPVWCFAQKTIGCRYCMESCEASCGEGISECESCYTCGGDLAQ